MTTVSCLSIGKLCILDGDDSSLEELFHNIVPIDSLEIDKVFIQRGRAVTSDELSMIMKVVDANSDGYFIIIYFLISTLLGVVDVTDDNHSLLTFDKKES